MAGLVFVESSSARGVTESGMQTLLKNIFDFHPIRVNTGQVCYLMQRFLKDAFKRSVCVCGGGCLSFLSFTFTSHSGESSQPDREQVG